MLQFHHSLSVLTAGAYEETKINIAISTKKVIYRQLVKL